MPDTIVSGNVQNQASAKHVNTHSRFDMSYHNFDTFRFGELHPHFVMECVPKDKVNLRCEHNLRSYSLKAPLMQKIQLKKDYFAVPMECILPFNWDKIYTNPVIGDDVTSDAGTYIANFDTLVTTFLNQLAAQIPDSSDASTTAAAYYTAIFRWLLTCELFASNGNLMSSLGIHLGAYWFVSCRVGTSATSQGEFDKVFDAFCSQFLQLWAATPSTKLNVQIGSDNYSFAMADFRQSLELMRDNLGEFSIWFNAGSISKPTSNVNSININNVNPGFGLDIKRLFAYQIVCAHYYSNDHVDYIYSAELYRQYIFSLISGGNTGNVNWSNPLKFNYNGVQTSYDYLSSAYFTVILTECDLANSGTDDILFSLSYLQAIFAYKHSLRYMDYFVGARTRPLAVGDVNIDVQSGTPNYVNVVDVTQRIQAQRFYNAVNKSGRKFSNYVKELFGVTPAPDYHNPFYLAHTADDVYGQEIENTNIPAQESAQQGLSIVSNLRSNASRFEFSFEADRPCIILGISYFDIPRAYFNSIERQNFHKDRFDMFNPYMQFIGDQMIYDNELNASFTNRPAFGYTNRYQEYHQRYNQAQGGFVNNLPGYVFLNDKAVVMQRYYQVISPAFIRSLSCELDRFYLSLTGYSLGSYFHFIVDNYNDCKASRPMAFSPSIL